jgi:Virulence factor
MARVRITYWQEIPVLVTAQDRDGETTLSLSPRFQELVDAVAMQTGLTDSEAYLTRWRTGPEAERDGPAAAVATAVVAELEASFAEIRAQYVRPGGPFNAH